MHLRGSVLRHRQCDLEPNSIVLWHPLSMCKLLILSCAGSCGDGEQLCGAVSQGWLERWELGLRETLMMRHFRSQRDCDECYWSGGCNPWLPAAWLILVQKVPQTPHTGHWASELATSTEILDVLMASPGEGGTFKQELAHTWGLLSTSGWAELCSCFLLYSPVHWVLSCVA